MAAAAQKPPHALFGIHKVSDGKRHRSSAMDSSVGTGDAGTERTEHSTWLRGEFPSTLRCDGPAIQPYGQPRPYCLSEAWSCASRKLRLSLCLMTEARTTGRNIPRGKSLRNMNSMVESMRVLPQWRGRTGTGACRSTDVDPTQRFFVDAGMVRAPQPRTIRNARPQARPRNTTTPIFKTRMRVNRVDFAFLKTTDGFNPKAENQTASTSRLYRSPVSRGTHSASTSRTDRCAPSMRIRP